MNLFSYAEKHYFDTTSEPVETLVKSESKAQKQEREILALFVDGQYFSQFSLRREYERRYHKQLLIASCSRAFSNLTDSGKLIKCDGQEGRELVQVMGEFGKNVFCWIKNEGDK